MHEVELPSKRSYNVDVHARYIGRHDEKKKEDKEKEKSSIINLKSTYIYIFLFRENIRFADSFKISFIPFRMFKIICSFFFSFTFFFQSPLILNLSYFKREGKKPKRFLKTRNSFHARNNYYPLKM